MAERYFLDTNILLYSIVRDPLEQAKQAIARALIDRGGATLSIQTLQEFIWQATHPKRREPITADQAWAIVTRWGRFPVQETTLALLEASRIVQIATGYTIWDCLIVAAARAQGCATLYTEDIQDGRIIDGLRIVNPFREGAFLP